MSPNSEPEVRRGETAGILEKLKLCKAFSPGGKVNGPNCQRFGRKDTNTGIWWWNVPGLIRIANERGTVSAELIESVAKTYNLSGDGTKSANGSFGDIPHFEIRSRAEAEQEFRELLLDLEAMLRNAVRGDRRDTLGRLIAKGNNTLPRHITAELGFVNATRNSLYHASSEVIDDTVLERAIESAKALSSFLFRKSIRVYRPIEGLRKKKISK